MKILPHDRIALIGKRCITIFPIPNTNDAGSISWAPFHILDLGNPPTHNGYLWFRSFHDHDHEFSIVVCSGSTHSIAIRIVHRNLEESRIMPLAQQSPGDFSMSVAGLYRTVVGSSKDLNELRLVNYAWDMASVEDPHVYVTEGSIKVPNLNLSSLIAYSEDTGRFVSYRGRTLYIHDPRL